MISSKTVFVVFMAVIYSVQAGKLPCKYPDWTENTQYCQGQKVTHGKSEWVAKWCTLEEPAPTNAQGQTSSWDRIRFCTKADCSARTVSARTVSARSSQQPSCDVPEWVDGEEYCKDEQVLYSKTQWIAKWCTLDPPGSLSPQGTTSAWISQGLCQDFCTAPLWVKGNEYCEGDEAVDKGVQWQALWCTLDEPDVVNPQGQKSAWIRIGACTMPTSTKTQSRARCV